MMSKKWTVEHSETNNLHWIEDENGITVCDLYHRIENTIGKFFIKSNAKEHAPIIAAAPEAIDLLKAFVAATEGVFECGHIRTEAMNLLKGVEGHDTVR